MKSKILLDNQLMYLTAKRIFAIYIGYLAHSISAIARKRIGCLRLRLVTLVYTYTDLYVQTTALLSVKYNVIRFKQRFYAPEKLVAFNTMVAETELRYT